MKKNKYIIYTTLAFTVIIILMVIYYNKGTSAIPVKRKLDNTQVNKAVTIYLQPFNDISPALSAVLFNKLKIICPNMVLNAAIALPSEAYYTPRKRYRADSLISYLAGNTADGNVTIGICSHDISTTKDDIEDWGVMGLGYEPGKACMVSTFRLKKDNLQEELFKVAIHELGHTQGLPHCEEKGCFMRDAEGGNPTDEEKDFCPTCKQLLKKKGWILPS